VTQLYVKASFLFIIVIVAILLTSVSAYIAFTEKVNYETTQQTLDNAIQILGQTSNELSVKNKQFIDAQSDIINATTDFNNVVETLQVIQNRYNDTTVELNNTYTEFDNAIYELNELKNGTRYSLHDPTYNETKDFILNDSTDLNEYIKGVYTCSNFAADVINNATGIRINCGVTLLYFNSSGHSIVCFNTTDKGIIFIEPQNDCEVDVVLNQNYSVNISWGVIERIIEIW